MDAEINTSELTNADKLVNEKVAAEFLGMTVRFMQSRRYKGTGPKFVRISPQCVRYRIRDLISWYEGLTVSSTSV
jgi:hypothetical protein